ncbi:acyltransferase family protein [Amycolatopsis benzoatilytica]|uniref:acyltransferase family protein n=1 Tax=Amycolatopsis benzoatilytica TaxID=346045 RepID=UPI001FDF8DDB|nr:acyltransferase [Amycolatopsis benzoatilytica]
MSSFRPVSVSSGNRRISWDLVRAGCVLLVLVYHATFLSVALHPELGPRRLVFPHQVGASLLLVISAYFAAVTIGRGSLGRYWWGRIARLLPPFLAAVVVIFFVLRYLSPKGWFVPKAGDLFANLLMLWNWKPAAYPFLDGSHWTIPLQLMAFTVAALLYRGSWGHGRKLHGLLWAAVLVPLLQWPFRVAGPPEWYRFVVDGFGFHRWHLFVAGVAVRLWSTKRLSTPEFVLLELVCVTAHALHGSTVTPSGITVEWGSTIGIAVGVAVISLAAAGPDWDRFVPPFARRAIQWFAGVSYGVFLIHQAIGYLVLHWLSGLGIDPLLQTAGMIATGVVLGWALTRLVERPAHRFLMRGYDSWTGRRRPDDEPAPVTAGNSG